MTFADKITAIMDHAQLSQTDVASRLGITQAHVSALVGGKRKPSRKLEDKTKRVFMVNELWWENCTGPIMSDEYFEESEREERYKRIRSVVESYYLPETISIADEIDKHLESMQGKDRYIATAKIFSFLDTLFGGSDG